MTIPPLKVLVVLPSPAWGGAESLTLSLLASGAHGDGDGDGDGNGALEVEVLALAEGQAAAEARRRGFPVEVEPVGARAADVAAGILRLARRGRRRDIDVVLANGVKAAAVAVPAARLVGLPVVWSKHDFSFDARLARPLGRLATAVVANSDEVARATGRHDVTVIHAPRPTGPLDRNEARTRLGALGVPDDAELVVACLGRLVSYKGFDTVVAALSRPGSERWHAVVIGDDDPAEPGERARLEEMARSRGLEGRVHLVGAVEDAGRLLRGVDAVAVLTRIDERGRGREGWSMVADEAMTAGVPVVAASGGPLAARLGDAGVVVAPDDDVAVAAALATLVDPDVRRRMGDAGRRQAAALPTTDEAADALVQVLAAAAHRPGQGRRGSAGPPMTVVVPAYNEEQAAEGSLRTVAAQLREGDQLLVVHDRSTDGTAAVLDRVALDIGPACVVVHRPPPASGIASARNEGIRRAANDHIACTDIGCYARPGWLDALRAGFSTTSSPSLVTGLYAVGGTSPVERAFSLACYPQPDEARRAGPWARLYSKFLGNVSDPTLPTGRSVAFTREAWSAVGGFPEHLATAEDVTFGRALSAAGHRCVLAADALVTWEPRADLADTARMYYRYGFGDGESGDRLLIGRNVARMAAYLLGTAAVVRGGRGLRATMAAGAAAYLSLPVARGAAAGAPPAVFAAMPVALAVKDIAKGVGCVRGLLVHWRP